MVLQNGLEYTITSHRKEKKMKKILTLCLIMVCGIAFARTSYWGEYEQEASREIRDLGDAGLTQLISEGVDQIANDIKWTGTRKECHDLFRNYLATQINIPLTNWDAEVTDAQDATVDFMRFMDQIRINNKQITAESKILILDFAKANIELINE